MSDDLISRKALLKKLEVFNDRDHGEVYPEIAPYLFLNLILNGKQIV